MLGPQDHRLDHAVRWGQRWAGRRSRTESHDAALLRRNRVEVLCPVVIATMMALTVHSSFLVFPSAPSLGRNPVWTAADARIRPDTEQMEAMYMIGHKR